MPPSTRYKQNWPETQERFEKWWKREPVDRPLLAVTAPRDQPLTARPRPADRDAPEKYLDANYLIDRYQYSFDTTWYGADAFPCADVNLGPGSLAIYLGSKPVFDPATVWYEPCIASLESDRLPVFNAQEQWFRRHLDLVGKVNAAFAGDAYTCIPDIIESLDILAAMRGPTQTLYDLMDRPEACHRWLKRINDLYQPYYDAFYNLVKDADGSSVFTAFRIWGPGKTCKVQCDFCAMISPDQFGEFYAPYLCAQMEGLDRVLYHLDGPEAIRHVPQLLAMERLNAIQWVAGAGKADNGDPVWYPLYQQILDGGKGLQVSMPARRVEAFVRRFGGRGIYLMTSTKTEREARELIALVERTCRGK